MFNPAHPGELIKETIAGIAEETGKKLSVEEVANGLGTTRKTLSAIINGKQNVTPEMAIKLAIGFSNTTPEFWLQVQDNYNLFQAKKKVDTKNIKVFWKAAALSLFYNLYFFFC
jgi:addiction module HigA family antidote